ncbi:MAG: hypothetical protein QOJ79_2320 [Actinomycetota bacterium]|nr:hypothetical protein [Actinomycetota bacterium]
MPNESGMPMTVDVAPPARPRRLVRDRLWSRLLLGAATVVFVLPWPHQVLSAVGTSDHRTLDSAGYSRSLTVPTQAAPRPARGDDILGSLTVLQQAGSNNKVAADRRLLCLALGIPGAYLLGRARRSRADKN